MSAAHRSGLNPLAWGLIAAQALLLIVTAIELRHANIQVAWSTAIPEIGFVLLLGTVWLFLARSPGREPREAVLTESFIALLLFGTFTFIALPAQYGGVALKRPFIDAALAAADESLGISVERLAAWWHAHSLVGTILAVSYASFLVQVFLPIVLLGFVFRERGGLWEYLFHVHVCSLTAIVVLTMWPAACAPVHYGFQPGIDQTVIHRDLQALHHGTFRVLELTELKGIVALPSLHTSLALAVTWAFRDRPVLFWPLVGINVGLIVSTFVSGIHYFVDVPAGALVVILSIVVYSRARLSRWV